MPPGHTGSDGYTSAHAMGWLDLLRWAHAPHGACRLPGPRSYSLSEPMLHSAHLQFLTCQTAVPCTIRLRVLVWVDGGRCGTRPWARTRRTPSLNSLTDTSLMLPFQPKTENLKRTCVVIQLPPPKNCANTIIRIATRHGLHSMLSSSNDHTMTDPNDTCCIPVPPDSFCM